MRSVLQLDEALPFQQRAAWLQRLGWLGMLMFVLAGSVGGFGQGPFARRAQDSGNGLLSLEYDRVAREGAVTRSEIRIDPAAIRNGHVDLHLGKEYLARVQIVSVVPAPAAMSLTPDGVRYRFSAVPTARALQLRIDSEPVHAGLAPLELKLADGTGLQVRQAVLP